MDYQSDHEDKQRKHESVPCGWRLHKQTAVRSDTVLTIYATRAQAGCGGGGGGVEGGRGGSSVDTEQRLERHKHTSYETHTDREAGRVSQQKGFSPGSHQWLAIPCRPHGRQDSVEENGTD